MEKRLTIKNPFYNRWLHRRVKKVCKQYIKLFPEHHIEYRRCEEYVEGEDLMNIFIIDDEISQSDQFDEFYVYWYKNFNDARYSSISFYSQSEMKKYGLWEDYCWNYKL